jgi:hypothetical protein
MDDRRRYANPSFLNHERGVHDEFRALLEAAPDAMVIGDAEARFRWPTRKPKNFSAITETNCWAKRWRC